MSYMNKIDRPQPTNSDFLKALNAPEPGPPWMRPLLHWLIGLENRGTGSRAITATEALQLTGDVRATGTTWSDPMSSVRWSMKKLAEQMLSKLDQGRNSMEWALPPYPLDPAPWRSMARALRADHDYLPSYLMGRAGVRLLGPKPEMAGLVEEFAGFQDEWKEWLNGMRRVHSNRGTDLDSMSEGWKSDVRARVEILAADAASPWWRHALEEIARLPGVVRDELDPNRLIDSVCR